MGFLRQEYWSELPFPPPEDRPQPRIKRMSPALVGGAFITESTGTSYSLSLQNIIIN